MRVEEAGFACILLSETAISDLNFSRLSGMRADAVIADLLYPGFFNTANPDALFGRLHGIGSLPGRLTCLVMTRSHRNCPI